MQILAVFWFFQIRSFSISLPLLILAAMVGIVVLLGILFGAGLLNRQSYLTLLIVVIILAAALLLVTFGLHLAFRQVRPRRVASVADSPRSCVESRGIGTVDCPSLASDVRASPVQHHRVPS